MLILQVIGLSGCVISLIGEVITLSQFEANGDRGSASAAVFFLFLHVAFFASAIDATTYIYASEIFPTPVRAKGLSISIAGLFLAALGLLQGAPTGFANIGWKYYLVCITVTSLVVVVIWFYFPEVLFSHNLC